jgi:hypothetical protein
MAKTFQITFAWPNDDWTWIDVEANDFHQAMLIALDKCPLTCRVQRIERLHIVMNGISAPRGWEKID